MGSRTKTLQEYPSYKYQWAREVAQDKLDDDFQTFKGKLAALKPPEITPDLPLPDNLTGLVSDVLPTKKLTGKPPKPPGKFKVGIVGAGCSGLFTAMILDHINEEIPDLNIEYDILEAAGKERLGGRLYTYKFPGNEKDYYDVGAMRFPDIPIMERTFQLFDLLDIKKSNKRLIPYYFKDDWNVCPTYFNNVHTVGSPKSWKVYKMNKGLSKEEKIPPKLLKKRPEDVLNEAIERYREQVKHQFDNKKGRKHAHSNGSEGKDDWIPLKDADYMSTRQYLRSHKHCGKKDARPGFNFNTIEWLETFDAGTGWYDQALTETVLESLDFDADAKWYCVNGGTQQVAREMARRLKRKPEFNRQVAAIKTAPDGTMSLKIKHNESPWTDSPSQTESRDYFAVFNSTTLGALQRMDLTEAGLRYGTKQAIRSLCYGAACKVAIKFKSAWWQLHPYNINRGGLGKTDLPIRVCVYPSYNLDNPRHESAVLLCSYTWSQDAQRLGSLISGCSPTAEEELREVLIHNLTLLHAKDHDDYKHVRHMIEKSYETHHAYDWYSDPYASGAFAFFGPGQFSNMWPEIIRPNGWLYLIGEAASAHHAWIVGALESSVRAVFQMLQSLHWQDREFRPYEDAMRLLSKENDDGLPFSPLPKEMPLRQKHDSKKKETADHPKAGKNLSYTAAEVALGFAESYVDKYDEEQGPDYGGDDSDE